MGPRLMAHPFASDFGIWHRTTLDALESWPLAIYQFDIINWFLKMIKWVDFFGEYNGIFWQNIKGTLVIRESLFDRSDSSIYFFDNDTIVFYK